VISNTIPPCLRCSPTSERANPAARSTSICKRMAAIGYATRRRKPRGVVLPAVPSCSPRSMSRLMG
jgi:methylphosphotriester-DNA--protein-cysteine methyltransferase